MDVKVLEMPIDEDLTVFARFLWKHRIAHRIKHARHCQELWLGNPSDVEFVLAQYEQWKRHGNFIEERLERAPQPSLLSKTVTWVAHVPITISLILISTVLTLLTGFGQNSDWLHWFTFVDFGVQGNYVLAQSFEAFIAGGQIWRWFTPVFLHFDQLHLIFNLLWMWELGRRIEIVHRRSLFIALILFMGVGSNIAQFVMTGPMFGGLSGVIFGMMAYTWLWDRICPQRRFGLPPVLMTFMVIWLVIGVSGFFEAVGFASMANTAHLVGLLCGLVGAPVVYLFRNSLWRKF